MVLKLKIMIVCFIGSAINFFFSILVFKSGNIKYFTF